jgi:four helix bundle protein
LDFGFWIFDLPVESAMNEQEFKDRTKKVGIRVIKMSEALPRTPTTEVISRQLLRSATSVGANYRSACRAKSTTDIIAKMAIVEEEADESLYWVELLVELNVVKEAQIKDLMSEMNEITAMTVASIKTLRARKKAASND